MKQYVAGFLFDVRDNVVALIKKTKGPANMAGKLNAIGGKIEEGESPLEAMIREFKEETDAGVTDWEHYCVLGGEGWVVHFFKAFLTSPIELKTTTDEEVDWYSVNVMLEGWYPMMRNLQWLIPMALDSDVIHANVFDGVPQ